MYPQQAVQKQPGTDAYGAPPSYPGAPVQPYMVNPTTQSYGTQMPVQTMPPQTYMGAPGPMQANMGVPGQAAPPVTWMPRPQPIPGCPPGLEYLTELDQLLVKQQIDIMEMVTNYQQENKYAILNSMGQQCYFASESSEQCMRQCCGPMREFNIHISDNAGVEVLRIYRPFVCCGCGSCCFCSCLQQHMAITTPSGFPVGSLSTQPKCCGQSMIIYDESETPRLDISGPCCVCEMCSNEFTVSMDGQPIGVIKKQWAGYFQEAFTTADNFGVTFSKDLDVKLKGSLLAATFLIDFMFFENKQNRNNRRGHRH